MTEEDFFKRGYKRFKSSSFDSDCVSDLYQKAIRDGNDDRLYFIDIKKWDFSRYQNRMQNQPHISYEIGTQLTHRETENALNITFISGWNLDDAERFIEQLWKTGLFRGYDERNGL